jgi:hypothetical protein
MHRLDAVLDAHYSLAMMKMRASRVSTREVIRVLQDEWGYPEIDDIRKSETGKRAGDHGLSEIARQEKAFYDALTAGEKAAYESIKTMVDEMYEKGIVFDEFDPFMIDSTVDDWKAKALMELALHPSRAYMLGQMLASERLKSPLHRPMMPTDARAIGFLNHYAFNEIHSSFDALKNDLRAALILGIEGGKNPREVARGIANAMKDYSTQWDVVAITETARAESQGRLRELQDAGETQCIGSTAHDALACDDCLRLINDKVYKVDEVLKNNNYGVKRANWKPCIPLHPRCRCVWLPYMPYEIRDDQR